MLSSRELPPNVRFTILKYVEEKLAGLYGHNKKQLRRFAAFMVDATALTDFRTIPAAPQAQPSAWCSRTASSLTFTLHSHSGLLHRGNFDEDGICLTHEKLGLFHVRPLTTSQEIVRCTRRPAVTHEWLISNGPPKLQRRCSCPGKSRHRLH
jgi:hypothetical protein